MKKFVCFTDTTKYELTDKEILDIKPIIDKLGNAWIQVNYYDFEYLLNQTLYCRAIDVIDTEE